MRLIRRTNNRRGFSGYVDEGGIHSIGRAERLSWRSFIEASLDCQRRDLFYK